MSLQKHELDELVQLVKSLINLIDCSLDSAPEIKMMFHAQLTKSLRLAVTTGKCEHAQWLIEHKADAKSVTESTMLSMLRGGDYADMMRLLLQHKVEMIFEKQMERRDAMYYSICYNRTECMRVLLEDKADPNGYTIPSYYGSERSYLRSAAYRGHTACVSLLLEYKASAIAKYSKFVFLDAVQGGNVECGRLLLEHKADLNLKFNESDDEDRPNALCLAATTGNLDFIRFLLEQKADANCTGYNRIRVDKNALDFAVEHGNLDCAKLLFEGKATVGITHANQHEGSERSGFMIACYRPHVDCIRWMLDVGADPNVSNRKTACPLAGAAESNRGAFELLCCGGNPQTCAHNYGYSRHIAEYMLVHSFISEYHSELTAVLDAVVVDTRMYRSSHGLYHEPLMLVLEYCGLRLKADQVLNEHIEAKEEDNEEATFTQRLLIPECRGTAAGYWLDLFYATTEHVQSRIIKNDRPWR